LPFSIVISPTGTPVVSRSPDSLWRITARIGQQLIHGRIDLLVSAAEATAIIDHKSFPGRFEQTSTFNAQSRFRS
jgi:hypothetical protein